MQRLMSRAAAPFALIAITAIVAGCQRVPSADPPPPAAPYFVIWLGDPELLVGA